MGMIAFWVLFAKGENWWDLSYWLPGLILAVVPDCGYGCFWLHTEVWTPNDPHGAGNSGIFRGYLHLL